MWCVEKTLFVALVLLSYSAVAQDQFYSPRELLAFPDHFNGKRVTARGWIDFGFERRFFYEAEEASRIPKRVPIDPDCISIEVVQSLRSKVEQLNHKYADITGVFSADIAAGRVALGLCNTAGIKVEDVVPAPPQSPP